VSCPRAQEPALPLRLASPTRRPAHSLQVLLCFLLVVLAVLAVLAVLVVLVVLVLCFLMLVLVLPSLLPVLFQFRPPHWHVVQVLRVPPLLEVLAQLIRSAVQLLRLVLVLLPANPLSIHFFPLLLVKLLLSPLPFQLDCLERVPPLASPLPIVSFLQVVLVVLMPPTLPPVPLFLVTDQR